MLSACFAEEFIFYSSEKGVILSQQSLIPFTLGLKRDPTPYPQAPPNILIVSPTFSTDEIKPSRDTAFCKNKQTSCNVNNYISHFSCD